MLHQNPSFVLAGRHPESQSVTGLSQGRRKSRAWEVEVFVDPFGRQLSHPSTERGLKSFSST